MKARHFGCIFGINTVKLRVQQVGKFIDILEFLNILHTYCILGLTYKGVPLLVADNGLNMHREVQLSGRFLLRIVPNDSIYVFPKPFMAVTIWCVP